jgi:HD-GYP domain-containing protein (c-di-GMP phosphodiesterase class II)
MRVNRLAFALADRIALPADERYVLDLAAWMHDVGKIGVPDRILTKPSALAPGEHEIMKQHSIKGGEIVGQIEELSLVADAIRHHHERMDGKGYPDGLRGEAIPLTSRIIHVADAFEAMTSDRSYRQSLSRQAALDELRRHSGTQFDADLVRPFMAVIEASREL